MTARESTARAFAWFGAAYPTARKIDQSTVEVWAESLYDQQGPSIEAAARHWIRTEQRFPNLAQFLEAVRAVRPLASAVGNQGPACEVCEGTGWEWADYSGRGTVARCRNLCLPPPKDPGANERGSSTAEPDVIAALREAQLHAGRRRGEIGDTAYLAEKGLEHGDQPGQYRFSTHGLIVQVQPPETEMKRKTRIAAEQAWRR